MGKNIHIEIPDEQQYEWLKEVKNERGLTWRGMLVYAADELELDRADATDSDLSGK